MTALRITYHRSGKMLGMVSISTYKGLNPYCTARQNMSGCVCSKCYVNRALRFENNANKFIENTKALTANVIDFNDLPIIKNYKYFRFEAFGDLINVTHFMNYYNLAAKNKGVNFCLFTKNIGFVKCAFDTYKLKQLKNLTIVLSNPILNNTNNFTAYANKYNKYINHIFNVYSADAIKADGVRINCGNMCADCGRCYKKGGDFTINEKLK